MTSKNDASIHWSFWVISVVALLWNLMGVVNFSSQTRPDLVATYPETHRAIIEGRPIWATAGFALAVFGGALGALLLLFRKSAALFLFIASLLGVILTMVHTLSATRSADFSAFEFLMMILLPLVVAAFLVWYAKRAEKQGWLT